MNYTWRFKISRNLNSAHFQERAEGGDEGGDAGGDEARQREVLRPPEVNSVYQAVVRLATKTRDVDDAETIDVGVDCDVVLVEKAQRRVLKGDNGLGRLRWGWMPLATSRQGILERQK